MHDQCHRHGEAQQGVSGHVLAQARDKNALVETFHQTGVHLLHASMPPVLKDWPKHMRPMF